MLNNYAEQVADFTEETIEGFSEPQRGEAFDYYESYVNDYAHGLNDSRGWNLSNNDLTTVIGKACTLVKQYIEE